MAETSSSRLVHGAEFSDYFRLLKPRVMSLVVFTATIGLLVAPTPINPVIGFASLLFIALGAGASGALNMWWDADIDAKMRRTIDRPIPAGKVTTSEALQLGLWLSVLSILMLALTANVFAAALLAFTIFFYVVVYSMGLKRLTPQNIVIGGAAGAFPPMIGWAVVTGGFALESFLMFAVIFMWTPPHFWALALFVKDDYANADVPMLTVTHGPLVTRRQIFIYAALLAPVALSLAFTEIGSPFYLIVALVLNARFVWSAFVISRRSQDQAYGDSFLTERHLFKQSLYYLFVLFSALYIGDVVQNWTSLPWLELF
ncbi:MAG: heme o synthase [Pseudomonadota bacterium]